ncbi:MAG TPA: hypothetical protein VHI52_01775 [Verrucomicrobiae bacterium]|nr:hypothetical protein [Verrucomicrobiae bacterium]
MSLASKHRKWIQNIAFLGLLAWSATAAAGTLYVDAGYTGAFELGTPAAPFKTVAAAESAASAGDALVIVSGFYPETVTLTTPGTLLATGGPVSIGFKPWGRLANPEFLGQRIRTTLFYAGRPLDGYGTAEENGCGPVPNVTNIYSVWPRDAQHLNWVDPSAPTSSANRDFVVRKMIEAGLNVVNMSSWGESWLPCMTPCPQVSDTNCSCQRYECVSGEPRCFLVNGQKFCLIGWYGSANMQVSPNAKDQLFDAAVGKPILIIPYIESRFGFDWDFHDEFPSLPDGTLAPGLISQIEDLINVYLLHPKNPEWPKKWARVYDQDGHERYAISIVQAATQMLNSADPNSHQKFAAGFDDVAQRVYADLQVSVGFFIDPVSPDPTSDFGCPGIDTNRTFNVYDSTFKPSPELTGPYLRQQKSILGIQCFSPEGWIDGRLGTGYSVTPCYKLKWKRDFSQRWFATGIPFLQDVTPGYDSTLLFAHREPDGGLKRWGYDDEWRGALTQMVKDFGKTGFIYNAWNGYPEGLAAMEVLTNGVPVPSSVTFDWLKSLTALYR